MRVLVVSCVFPPEPVTSAQTSAQIAEELARRGHAVTVITAFPSRPAGQLYPGYRRRLVQRQFAREGYELVRCFASLSAESGMLSRVLENLSFGLTAGWAALTARRPDVIYANTWPILAAGVLFAVAQLRGIPLVISIQDVYPESLISQRRIHPQSWLVRLMQWWDGLVARRSRAVIVISERFAAVYRQQRGVMAERLHVVPNWGDDRVIPLVEEPSAQFRAQLDIPGEAFVGVYGGNIGAAAGVETLIQALHDLKDELSLYLVIAGEGSRLEACQALADQVDGQRIRFHTPWPAEETGLVLRAADVLLLPTHGRQSLASLPSKLIAYLLSARPVIALALPQSDLADLVEQSGGGWVVEPGRPDLLAVKLREVIRMGPAERARRGQAGREFALRRLTREACLPNVIRILEQAAARGRQ